MQPNVPGPTTKRVLLLSNGSLLMASVRRLLQVQGTGRLEVASVAVDDPEAATRIVGFAPDAIILDTDGPSRGQELIAQVLADLPGTSAIALNAEPTQIAVYRAERLRLATLDGLLEAIQASHMELHMGTRGEEAPQR